MSWHFSRALVAEYSGGSSWDGEPSAPSKSTPTPGAFYWPDKTTGHSRLSRFGMTSEPLTDAHGEALLTWFRAASLARTSAAQEAETGSTASAADSGTKWPVWFARFDRATYSWRTPQCSLVGDFTEFSETWPRWGVMRDGVCSELPMSERYISASASGLWPTPTCGGGGQTLPEGTTPTGMTPDGRKQTVCVERYVQQVERGLWPTPTVHGNYNRKGASAQSGDGLATAVKFATPQARDYRSGEAARWEDKRRSRNLNDQIARFPTPTVAMVKGSSGGALTRKTGKSRENDRLDYKVEGDASNGRLNPPWVEWLMGWPIGWTGLQPLETDRFQEWLQQHGGS